MPESHRWRGRMKVKYYEERESSSGDSSDDDEIMAKHSRTHKFKGRPGTEQPVRKVIKKLRKKDNRDRELKPSQSRPHAKVQSDLVPKRTLYHKTCDLNRMDLNWRKKLVQDQGHDTDWYSSPLPPPPPDEQYPEASRKLFNSKNPLPFQQPGSFNRRRKKPRKRKQNPCYSPGPYGPNAYCPGQPCGLGSVQHPCSNFMGGPTIIGGMPCASTSSYYPPPGTQQVGYLMLGSSGYQPMMSGQLQFPVIMAQQQLGSSPAYGTSVPGAVVAKYHLGQSLQGPRSMVPGHQQYMTMSVAGAPMPPGFGGAHPFAEQVPSYFLGQPLHPGSNYPASPVCNRHPGGTGFVMASAPAPGIPAYAAPPTAGPGPVIYGNGALPPSAYQFPPGNPSTGPFQAVSFSQGAGYVGLPPRSAGFTSKPY